MAELCPDNFVRTMLMGLSGDYSSEAIYGCCVRTGTSADSVSNNGVCATIGCFRCYKNRQATVVRVGCTKMARKQVIVDRTNNLIRRDTAK